jgi:hypothetical protein
MTESLVLDNSGVADTLVLAEDTVGKRVTFLSDLQPAIGEVVKINILTAQTFREVIPFQDDLLAVVRHRQLLADVTLFTVAEDIVQSSGNDVESAVQVLRLDGSHGEAFVEK